MCLPTAEEDIVRPHHGQREQMVHLPAFKVTHVSQDKLPPGLPVFPALPITPKRLHSLSFISVLLNKILHVRRRHLAPQKINQDPPEEDKIPFRCHSLGRLLQTATRSGRSAALFNNDLFICWI